MTVQLVRHLVVQRLRDLWKATPALAGVDIIDRPGLDRSREAVLVGVRVRGPVDVHKMGGPRPWRDTFTVSVAVETMVPGATLTAAETRLNELVSAVLDSVFAAPTLGAPAIAELVGLNAAADPVDVDMQYSRLDNTSFAGVALFDLPFTAQHC